MYLKYNLRGVVGKDLNEKEIRRFAKNIVSYIYVNKHKPCVVIGKDNRVTSDYILNFLNSILLKSGIEVSVLGTTSTPEVAYLTKKFKYTLGIMITASHNSYEYNGFKCFNVLGEMVDIDKQVIRKVRLVNYKKLIDAKTFKEVYLRELKNKLNPNNIKCIFDCANGTMVDIVRKIFPRNQIIGNNTSGEDINQSCGSQCLDRLINMCKKYKKIGFAFDGDGDRVIAIDENGSVVDGDKIIYILATQKLGFGDKVVGTQISSLGLEISLRRLGVSLIRERVGAKYVARRIKKENVILGGETCGHIFLSSAISDGVAIVIELLNILNRTGLTFEQLLSGYKQTFKLTKDFKVDNLIECDEYEKIDNNVRVVVRRSGTEDVVRVFVEGENIDAVKLKFEEVVKSIAS